MPNLRLTEAALGLVTHATHDIAGAQTSSVVVGRILTNALGASTSSTAVFAETAILRLMSIVEAYLDSVSALRMGSAIDSRETLVLRLVEDFDVSSSSTWQSRKDAYERYHGFRLESQPGWQAIDAAIEVRNCLAHGLGALTAKQRRSSKISRTIGTIGATLGGGRIYLGTSTVRLVGTGCAQFLRGVDTSVGALRY